ncbi:hypothetical protein BDN72DRAFT_828836 [Pluteus cervinus]|uniref:Uncharacterized protein n=1 Tax=Pluteus cervinus TaxID=181527 RepID=A0ACD3A4I7_9AGAR|nr:hypothetical protein BDN72DRAFT_828836 [Pluteus cervinus]
MFILLLASLLGASAFPISGGPETTPTIAHTIIWGIQARGDGSGMVERTMLSIVRSCLLTVAACVYRAIHQNIPDPEAGWWKRQAIRAKITFFALMAPEAIIFWAMRQWFGAKEVADQINGVKPELKWTRTHGHFAQMGGFERLDNRRVLHPPTLIALLKDGQIDVEELERVSTKRINDCSKGDILSKGIVALQTTWFVFECLARLHQGLPLLELEVVTLAFAVLNTVTYAFWWHKPLNILCPIHLHILPPPEAPNTPPPVSEPTNSPPPTSSESLPSDQAVNLGSTGENSPLLDSSVVEVKEKREGDGVIEGAWKAVVDGITGAGRSVSGVVESVWEWIGAVGEVVKKDVQKRPWWKTVWKRLITGLFFAVVGPLWDLFDDEEVHDDATHVSTFYGMEISEGKRRVVWFSSCFIGMIFGAIHFLSWHSAFPTHTQLLLWRISSIVLVAEPFCLALEVERRSCVNPFHPLCPHILLPRSYCLYSRPSVPSCSRLPHPSQSPTYCPPDHLLDYLYPSSVISSLLSV